MRVRYRGGDARGVSYGDICEVYFAEGGNGEVRFLIHTVYGWLWIDANDCTPE